MSSPDDQPWILTTDPVLRAVAEAAAQLTGGSASWIVAIEHDRLRVMAAVGDAAAHLQGANPPGGEGTVGYVTASGQPLALRGGDDDRFAQGVCGLLERRPDAVLCVPCLSDDGVVGALEVIDKADGQAFTFDDLEEATVLAGVAGAALAAGALTRRYVLSPTALSGELLRLAAVDPDRYAAISAVMSALLANG
jgi:GAF domain-containing protein